MVLTKKESPIAKAMGLVVETIGIEPMTSCMSSKRSNHLGYASEDEILKNKRFLRILRVIFGIQSGFYTFLLTKLLTSS